MEIFGCGTYGVDIYEVQLTVMNRNKMREKRKTTKQRQQKKNVKRNRRTDSQPEGIILRSGIYRKGQYI